MSEFEAALYRQLLMGAGIVLTLGWLLVSFMAPSRTRSVVEWISAMALYVGIGSIMARLFHRFWIEDNEALIGIFGFLCLIFGSGLVVSFALLLRTLAGRDPGAGAAH